MPATRAEHVIAMTHNELHKKIVVALYKRGRSEEQSTETAHRIPWANKLGLPEGANEGFLRCTVQDREGDKKGSAIRVRGGSRKLQEFASLVEKQTSVLFRRRRECS